MYKLSLNNHFLILLSSTANLIFIELLYKILPTNSNMTLLKKLQYIKWWSNLINIVVIMILIIILWKIKKYINNFVKINFKISIIFYNAKLIRNKFKSMYYQLLSNSIMKLCKKYPSSKHKLSIIHSPMQKHWYLRKISSNTKNP
jgi:hypothetical protein